MSLFRNHFPVYYVQVLDHYISTALWSIVQNTGVFSPNGTYTCDVNADYKKPDK